MEYNLQQNLEYCYQFFVESQGLLFYTHVPPIVIALLFTAFILYRRRDRLTYLLAGIALTFTAFASIDLLQWIWIDSSSFIMASWSVLGLLSALMFFLTHWFVHVFTTGRSLPAWMSYTWLVAMAPVIVFTPTRYNLAGYDIRDCIAIEGPLFTNYYYLLGILAIALIAISVFFVKKTVRLNGETRLAQNLVFVGSTLFIFSFLTTGVISSYLVDNGYLPDFGLAQYGIAAMSVFIGFLAYVTAYYRGFNVKTLAAEILVVGLIILIASEFLFVSTPANRILVSITLLFSTFFGTMLIRSVRREVEQRELIEKQEKELELANQKQESLLHFISHEIKGYLTEGQNAFAGIIEGDFGDPAPKIKSVSETALTRMRAGVATVMNILDASNLKKGTVNYSKETFDFKAAVIQEVDKLKDKAAQKGLDLSLQVDEAQIYTCVGDSKKVAEHVIRNLVDNSIRYTPKGRVTASLSRLPKSIHFSVKDSGVGITPEDMKRLFTEGGHGKDSIKVNVDSTGYGLFVAKQVVDAHNGKIWAESAGAGHGSEFIVELPVA